MIDIFRNAEAVSGVTDEALAMATKPKVIWMQLDIRNDEAATKAESHGLKVIMNRCPAIELGHN
jgi:predicted CoA-binding protein